MNPEQVIARSQPVVSARVFVVGVKERGVTVASQQRRAIHLIDALVQAGVVCAGSRIAVVGAGAAGLSASVRAAHAGCEVVLLERNAEILSTFRGNGTRLLHPNLYSWPSKIWEHPHADLPLLDWSADKAGNVARVIENAFRNEVRRTGLIKVVPSAQIEWQWPLLSLPSPVLNWRVSDAITSQRFAAVVLAVGFGTEKGTGSGFPGYWENDSVESGASRSLSYFIQGAGDGGLTDMLRVRLSTFDQATFFSTVLKAGTDQQIRNLCEAVGSAEIELKDDVALDAFYRDLKVAWLDDALRACPSRPHRVVLSDVRAAFGRGRFALNKLLASCLLRIGDRCEWVQGASEIDPGGHAIDLDGKRLTFDRVLIRRGGHGPIDDLGDPLIEGCRAMVERGIDTGDIAPPPSPSKARNSAAIEALRTAVALSSRVIDVVRILLLNLRATNTLSVDPTDHEAFDNLWYDAYVELKQRVAGVVLDCAQEVSDFASAFVFRNRSEPCAVVARALAEALDDVLGKRLYAALRGNVRFPVLRDWSSNELHPRKAPREDPRGRRDGGLSTLALVPSANIKCRIQWARDVWAGRQRIVVATPLASIEELTLAGHGAGEFFGAVARDPAHLRRQLEQLLRDGSITQDCFLLLPEFTLHADLAICGRAPCNLFGGIGHVVVNGRRVHHRVMKLGALAPVLVEKSAPTEYPTGSTTWREDIHVGEPHVLAVVSADGTKSMVLAGPDGWTDEAFALVAQIGPRVVLNVGWTLPDGLTSRLSALQIGCISLAFRPGSPEAPSPSNFEIIRKF